MRKYEYFSKSLNNLVEGLETKSPYSIVELTGVIGLFEICFDQSWKMMRQLLESHGLYKDTATPRAIIKLAYQYGMINDEETWIEIQKARNLLAHIYSEEDSLQTIEKIKASYLKAFLDLKDEVETNWLEDLPLDD